MLQQLRDKLDKFEQLDQRPFGYKPGSNDKDRVVAALSSSQNIKQSFEDFAFPSLVEVRVYWPSSARVQGHGEAGRGQQHPAMWYPCPCQVYHLLLLCVVHKAFMACM